MSKVSGPFQYSQSLRDVSEDYYSELRKPKRVVFFVNGNDNYISKVMSITPNRYFVFNELLDSLTKCFIKYIPCGARRIYSASDEWREIKDLEDLEDGKCYVCCGTEPVKTMDYEMKYQQMIVGGRWLQILFITRYPLRHIVVMHHIDIESDPHVLYRRYIWGRKRHIHNHNSQIKFFYAPPDFYGNSETPISPKTPLIYHGTRLYPIGSITTSQMNTMRSSPRSDNEDKEVGSDKKSDDAHQNNKPRLLTVIRNSGNKPYTFCKILMNRNSDQSMPDLLSNISEVFEESKPISKLFTATGKEMKDKSDLFRGEKYFVAIGDKEGHLSEKQIRKIISDTFPDWELSKDDHGKNTSGKKMGGDANQKSKTVIKKDDQNALQRKRSDEKPKVSKDKILQEVNGEEHPSYCDSKDPYQRNDVRKPKLNRPKANPSMNYPSQTYPLNDSRKPGAFDMVPEEPTENVMTAKLRAQLFGLERIRAGLEERERVRQLMAKKLEWRKKMAEANFKRKFESNPYLENQDEPSSRWLKDKENYQDLFKNKFDDAIPYGSAPNGIRNNKKRIWKPAGSKGGYFSSDDDYDKDGNMNKFTWGRLDSQNPKGKLHSKFDDRRTQPQWRRIPPLNLSRNDLRSLKGEKYFGASSPDPNNPSSSSLPTLHEEDDAGKSKYFNDRRKEPLSNQRNNKSLSNTNKHYWSPEAEKDRFSFRNKQPPQTKEKNQSVQCNLPERSKSDIFRERKERNNRRKSKEPISPLIGPRSETLNTSNPEWLGIRPHRTKDQSVIVQDHRHDKRVIPNLAIQLDKDDDFSTYYQPGAILGMGNFADVKETTHKDSGKQFAVKIIDKKKLKDKEDLIEEEIRILQNCDHPNIVKLQQQFESPNKVFIVQELLRDGDLFDTICEHVKFPESSAAMMTRDLLNALFYLHCCDIVHRDIKPENLLCVIKDGNIHLKLVDFGLAIETKEPLYVICGTPTYVAPEILTKHGYGKEIDIWAAGAICYILICGFPPFRSPDRNQTELFEFIKAGEYEYPKPYWNNVSDEAKDLISRMLTVDREKRFTALDCLCHSWIVTLANSVKFAKPLLYVINDVREELHKQKAIIRTNYHQVKARN